MVISIPQQEAEVVEADAALTGAKIRIPIVTIPVIIRQSLRITKQLIDC